MAAEPLVLVARLGTEAPSMLFACAARCGLEVLIDLRDEVDPQAAEWRPALLRRAAALRGIDYLRIPAPWSAPKEGLATMRNRLAGASVCLLYESAPQLRAVKKAIAPVSSSPLFEEEQALLELAFWRSLEGAKSTGGSSPRERGTARGTWRSRKRGKKKTWADVARELEEGA